MCGGVYEASLVDRRVSHCWGKDGKREGDEKRNRLRDCIGKESIIYQSRVSGGRGIPQVFGIRNNYFGNSGISLTMPRPGGSQGSTFTRHRFNS
jgi:hypothetical protein